MTFETMQKKENNFSLKKNLIFVLSLRVLLRCIPFMNTLLNGIMNAFHLHPTILRTDVVIYVIRSYACKLLKQK